MTPLLYRDLDDLMTYWPGETAPAPAPWRDWHQLIDRVRDWRGRALQANRHDVVLLIDAVMLHANQRDTDMRTKWRHAIGMIRRTVRLSDPV